MSCPCNRKRRPPCIAYVYSDWNEIRNPLGCGAFSPYDPVLLATSTACGKCCKNLCPSTCCVDLSTSENGCCQSSSSCCQSSAGCCQSTSICPANCRKPCCRPRKGNCPQRKIIINVQCNGACKPSDSSKSKNTTSKKSTSKNTTSKTPTSKKSKNRQDNSKIKTETLQ